MKTKNIKKLEIQAITIVSSTTVSSFFYNCFVISTKISRADIVILDIKEKKLPPIHMQTTIFITFNYYDKY